MKTIYRRLSLTVTLVLMLASVVRAQERTVTGTVTDEAGAGMPGVNVLIKGTGTGTATDADGKYSLSVPNNDAIIVVTFVGYATTEVPVGSQTVVDVTMTPDVETLTEVVVTGYSTEKRRDVVGAVSTVDSKDLTVVPSGNIEQQLQGRVSGVTVVTNGQPGTTSQIRVRGFGAFGGNQPLYIVDGVPTESTEFLNPDDIETTTVLKDASTASIYGARAANGVIVYTTKNGARDVGKLTITYDGMFGFTDPGDSPAIMNPQDHANWTWNALRNTAMQNGTVPEFDHPQFGTGETPVIPDYILVGENTGVVGPLDLEAERAKYNVTNFDNAIYQVVRANKSGTNWYDEITHTAPIIRNSIGVRGGTDKSRFFFGLGMQDQSGILLHQNFKRYSFRVNSEFDILRKLRLGENLQFTYRQVKLLQGNNGGAGVSDDENDVLFAFRMPTIIPVYDEFGGYAGTRAKGFNNPRNPVANLDRMKDDTGFSGTGFGNVYLEFEPIENLVARTSIGGSYGSFHSRNYFARQYENSENNSAVTYGESSGYGTSWVWTNTLNYKKEFGNNNFDFLLGYEALNTGMFRNMGGNGLNPFSENRDYVTLSTTTPGSSRTVGSDYAKGVNFSSIFGRINYILSDKYLASVVIRRDGSSRFSEENRYGTFPSFSVGWRISEEGFMNSAGWIDELKLRAGYGIMGNSNNVNPNNQYTLYGVSVDNSSYPIGNAAAAEGVYRTRIGNPEAKWERAVTANIGFDATLINGKLDIVFDVWQKDTEDLIFALPLTYANGSLVAVPDVNVGKMNNRGVDIQVISRGNMSAVGYELTVNGGFLHNEIVELAPGITYLTGGDFEADYRGIRPIRNEVGHPISSFYGFNVVGLWQNQEEINSANAVDGDETSEFQSGAAPGRFRFEDVNGDGKINPDDRKWLGSPVPKFTGGLNLKLTYKNFDFETYMFASIGNKIWNQSKWFTDFYPSFAGAAISERVKDSWTTTNTGAEIPIFENVSNFSTNTQPTSFYVENGSYFRMQNITLGFNIPLGTLDRWGMEKLRIYAGVNNVFTITEYEGLDPSVGGDADTRFGIDVGNYPITRSWTFGVNLGF
jgi:TonB-dependent starch-binding outer membrane protein SusC